PPRSGLESPHLLKRNNGYCQNLRTKARRRFYHMPWAQTKSARPSWFRYRGPLFSPIQIAAQARLLPEQKQWFQNRFPGWADRLLATMKRRRSYGPTRHIDRRLQ